MTPPLAKAIEKLATLGNGEQYTFASDPKAASALLAALEEAKAAFALAPRASQLDDTTPTIAVTPMTASTLSAPAAAPVAAPPVPSVAKPPRPIILFDGVCLLCSAFIHFVLDHDKEGRYDFAPLQGPTAKALLTKAGLPLDVSTVVLLDETGVHTRSTAALRVLACCGKPYSLLHS